MLMGFDLISTQKWPFVTLQLFLCMRFSSDVLLCDLLNFRLINRIFNVRVIFFSSWSFNVLIFIWLIVHLTRILLKIAKICWSKFKVWTILSLFGKEFLLKDTFFIWSSSWRCILFVWKLDTINIFFLFYSFNQSNARVVLCGLKFLDTHIYIFVI